jgi:hypothetical protein
MASKWSIIIERDANHAITFTPDLPGATAGQPLGASAGDNVTWNNRTNDPLELLSITPPNVYLTEPILPGTASNPIFLVSESVTYSCVNPSQPQHSIVVT